MEVSLCPDTYALVHIKALHYIALGKLVHCSQVLHNCCTAAADICNLRISACCLTIFPSFIQSYELLSKYCCVAIDQSLPSSTRIACYSPPSCSAGASVIYADTVADLGYAGELGNYAEYSGAPNQQVI